MSLTRRQEGQCSRAPRVVQGERRHSGASAVRPHRVALSFGHRQGPQIPTTQSKEARDRPAQGAWRIGWLSSRWLPPGVCCSDAFLVWPLEEPSHSCVCLTPCDLK